MSIEKIEQPAEIKQLLTNRSITNLMYIIWSSRKDLQRAFDLDVEEGQKGYCQWYDAAVQREYGIVPQSREKKLHDVKVNKKFVLFHFQNMPLHSYLVRLEQPIARLAHKLPLPIKTFGKSVWYYMLSFAARRAGSNNQSNRCKSFNHSVSSVIHGDNGANLIGYANAELGMGEHVRMTAAALDTTDVKFSVLNFDVGVLGRQKAVLEHGTLDTDNIYRANIFHINADQMLRTYCHLGRNFFSNKYNVGYWAWELAKCPNEWVPILGLVDEIWAPSKFIQSAFSEKTDKPVEYMPLCVYLPEFPKLERQYFSLPNDAYLFLYTFDFYSYIDRKNPFAAIRAFKKAFSASSKKVGLVLKVMNGDEKDSKWKQMMELIGMDDRIFVINKTLNRKEVLALFETCNSFVSLHRSEGFGRGPAEAMFLGKPVIVTNYSGNIDFTRSDNACIVDYKLVPVKKGQYTSAEGQVWAEADIEHAAWYMQKLVNDSFYASDIGGKGRFTIHTEFSPSVIGEKYNQRLKKFNGIK